MDNINMLLPSTNERKDIKLDKVSIKSSNETSKDSKNTFDSQLTIAKGRDKGKDINFSKSIIKDNLRDIPVNKSLDVKRLSEEENIEAVYNIILTLINNIMEIPIADIEKILQVMDITPTDLLNQDTFKAFLTYAYPNDNEHELLFNEDKWKDISKLFVKLEQINSLIQGQQSHMLIEKWVLQDEVVKTTVNEVNIKPNDEKENSKVTSSEQIIALGIQVKDGLSSTKDKLIDEVIPEGKLSDEELLNFKHMGLGLNMPIQAMNTTIATKFWDAQTMQLNTSSSLNNESITHQMINKLDITTVGNSKEITMELSPKELGNLSIKLVETNGILIAHIRVETEKTKELLLSEIAQLKQALEGQGLSISEVKVDIRQNTHQDQMEQQRQKSTKRIQQLIDHHLLEVQNDEEKFDERTGELIETEVNYMV